MDKLKLSFSALIFMGGIAGSYVLSDLPVVLRVLCVLIGFALAFGLLSMTEKGRELIQFGREAIVETKKVVWPSKKETAQTTGIVVVFVLVMALVLWGIDGILGSVIRMILGVEG
ncbi:MAG: preprotein translocase subunit SecE [Betaproteobacteria bacterium]|nr:preprotein translocase subunit SecE [Betaproteobacteria bacterium]MBT7998085.1 preprotein translocase subunit SecE [Betaproteobacteria bacterium]